MHRFAYYQTQHRGSSFNSSLGFWPSCQDHPVYSPIQHQVPDSALLALTPDPTKGASLLIMNAYLEGQSQLDPASLSGRGPAVLAPTSLHLQRIRQIRTRPLCASQAASPVHTCASVQSGVSLGSSPDRVVMALRIGERQLLLPLVSNPWAPGNLPLGQCLPVKPRRKHNL